MSTPKNPQGWFLKEHAKTSVDALVAAALEQDNAAELIADMAVRLRDRLSRDDAATLAALARSLAPDDLWVQTRTSNAVMSMVPSWHWAMARDSHRNDTYDRALRASIGPDSVVLEVGTGSGILAMMAAKAGARHVYTIEIVPLIAAAARENIRRNGYSDRITVIEADATKVTVGDQLPERCNTFVHEIVSNTLLGEHVLPITQYVRAELLTEDALLLPDTLWTTCQLSQMPQTSHKQPLGMQSGFDLSAMDLLLTPKAAANGPLEGDLRLSDPFETLRFDLAGGGDYGPEDVIHNVPVTQAGQANTILQWIGFSFPCGTRYANPPEQYSCWGFRTWPIAERPVRMGEVFRLRHRHNTVTAVASAAE